MENQPKKNQPLVPTTTKNALTPHNPTSLAEATRPRNLREALELCDIIARSDMVPKQFQNKPGNVFLAWETGDRLGYGILQSLQNIAVINGKPTIYGDEMLARVRRSPEFESIVETGDETFAECVVKRRNQPEVTSTFTIDDAKRAGLLNKPGPWTQYRKRMLKMKARNYALRDAFGDVLGGIISTEDARDSQQDQNGIAPHSHQASLPASYNAQGDGEAVEGDGELFEAAPVRESDRDEVLKLQSFLQKIKAAESIDELNAIIPLAKFLPADLVSEARAAFRAKKEALTTAEAMAEP